MEAQTNDLRIRLKQLQDTMRVQNDQYQKINDNNIAEKNDLQEQVRKRLEYEELYHSTLKQYEDMKILKRKREYEMKELESQRKAEIQNKLQVNAELIQLRADHKQLANQIEVEESRHKKYLDALQSEVQQLRQLKKTQQTEIKALENKNEMLSVRLGKLNYKTEHPSKKQSDSTLAKQFVRKEDSTTTTKYDVSSSLPASELKKWFSDHFVEVVESSLRFNSINCLASAECALKLELADLQKQLSELTMKQSKNERSLIQQVNDVKAKMKTYKLSNHKQLPSLMEYYNELQLRFNNKSFLSMEEKNLMEEILTDINDITIQLSLNQTAQKELGTVGSFRKALLTKELKSLMIAQFEDNSTIPEPISQFYRSFYEQLPKGVDLEFQMQEHVLFVLVQILGLYMESTGSLQDLKALNEALEQDKESLSNQYHNSRMESNKRIESMKIEYEDKVRYLLQQIRSFEVQNAVDSEKPMVASAKYVGRYAKDSSNSNRSYESLQTLTLKSIQQSLNSTITNMQSPAKQETRQSWGSTDSLNLPIRQK